MANKKPEKRLTLPEFIKKKHPEFKGKRINKKLKAEYRKYLLKFKKDKKKEDKEFQEAIKFDREMTAKEKALDKEEIEKD